jgi:hypothetical protein
MTTPAEPASPNTTSTHPINHYLNSTATDPDTAVALLDSTARQRLLQALLRAQDAETVRAILDEITTTLQRAEPGRAAVGVVFRATEGFDDGYSLSGNGEVLFADGGTDEIEFDLDNHFSNYDDGPHGPHFTLTVDLRTGEFTKDDDDRSAIFDRFQIEPPAPPAVPERQQEPPPEITAALTALVSHSFGGNVTAALTALARVGEVAVSYLDRAWFTTHLASRGVTLTDEAWSLVVGTLDQYSRWVHDCGAPVKFADSIIGETEPPTN